MSNFRPFSQNRLKTFLNWWLNDLLFVTKRDTNITQERFVFQQHFPIFIHLPKNKLRKNYHIFYTTLAVVISKKYLFQVWKGHRKPWDYDWD